MQTSVLKGFPIPKVEMVAAFYIEF